MNSLKKEGYFWLGAVERENPFLKWMENKDKQLKALRKNIVHLEEQNAQNDFLQVSDLVQIKRHFHPLAEQNLELREYTNIPLPKEKDMRSFWEQKIQSEFFGKDVTKGERAGLQRSQSDAPSLKPAPLFEDFFEESGNEDSLKKDEVSLNKELLKKNEAFLDEGEAKEGKVKEGKVREGEVRESAGAGNENYRKDEPALEEKPAAGSHNPLLQKMEMKERELKALRAQWEKIKNQGLKKEDLIRQAKAFELKGIKGKLLVLPLPLEDRKILSDLSDTLLSALSSGVLVLVGELESKHPVIVSVTKNFQKLLSAGDILKNTVAPVCKGRGGGKASFAQGSISDLTAFSQLESLLLKKWNKGC